MVMERVMGIEPTSFPWKGNIIAIIRHPHFGVPRFELGLNPPKGLVLPLHYTPIQLILY